jgi:hypothetical protein
MRQNTYRFVCDGENSQKQSRESKGVMALWLQTNHIALGLREVRVQDSRWLNC